MKVIRRKKEDRVVVAPWKRAASERFALPVDWVSDELAETYRIMVREERNSPDYLAAQEKCLLLAHSAWMGRLE